MISCLSKNLCISLQEENISYSLLCPRLSYVMADQKNEGQQCQVCLDDLVKNNPRLLRCHHSFCEKCIIPMIKNDQVKCPTCREDTVIPNGDVTKLSMNFWLKVSETPQANTDEVDEEDEDEEEEEDITDRKVRFHFFRMQQWVVTS